MSVAPLKTIRQVSWCIAARATLEQDFLIRLLARPTITAAEINGHRRRPGILVEDLPSMFSEDVEDAVQ